MGPPYWTRPCYHFLQSYVAITKMMDTHDVGRGRGGTAAALGRITQPVMICGITSDVLYPLETQEELHALIPNSEFRHIESPEGHDGFLLEVEQVSRAVTDFVGSRAKL